MRRRRLIRRIDRSPERAATRAWAIRPRRAQLARLCFAATTTLSALALAFTGSAAASGPSFVRAFGKDVGGSGVDLCTTSCQAGSFGGAAGQFNGLEGVAVAGSGDVYIADERNQRIDEYSQSGSFVRAFGKGVKPGGGDVCTTSCRAGTAGGGRAELNFPRDVAVAGSGDVYVADLSNSRIDEYNQSGSFVRAFGKGVNSVDNSDICTTKCRSGSQGGGAGALSGPYGVAVAGSGDVYVADESNNRINEYNQSGSFVRAFGKDVGGAGVDVCTTLCQAGSAGGGTGQLNGPFGVAVAGSGDVYVADEGNNRIDQYNQSGNFVRAFGKDVGGTSVDVCTTSCEAASAGGDAGQLNGPVGVAVAGSGDVYVADESNNRIDEYNQSGSFVRAFGNRVNNGSGVCTTSCQAGSAGGDAGQLNGPVGVAVAGSGDVYVVDYLNNRIEDWSPAQANRPANTGRPSLRVSGQVGELVTCKPGTWTSAPDSFAFSWTIDAALLAGQHGNTYKLAAADAGHKLRCQVVAHNAAGDSAPASSNALAVARPKSSCRDTVPPTSKIKKSQSGLKNGTLTLRGSAKDKPCKGKPGHVVRVVVTIARRVKGGCRFLREDRSSFGSVRSCNGAPPIVFPAKGKGKWSLKLTVVLPAGTYTIRSLATDAAGNRERIHRKGANVLSLHVK